MLLIQACLDLGQAEEGGLERSRVPSSPFLAAAHPGLCPLEGTTREAAALLQSGWLGWKFGTSQSLSGNLDSFFFFFFLVVVGFNLCIYFWLPAEGSTVPSCRSMN